MRAAQMMRNSRMKRELRASNLKARRRRVKNLLRSLTP
jgi:hypothetical protein